MEIFDLRTCYATILIFISKFVGRDWTNSADSEIAEIIKYEIDVFKYSNLYPEIKVTSWKINTCDLGSRVMKYQKTNE